MTIKVGKKEISSNDILLSTITVLMGIILWFFMGVVNDVNALTIGFNKANTETKTSFAKMDGKLGTILQWTELYKPKIDNNANRSVGNATRLTVLESIKPY